MWKGNNKKDETITFFKEEKIPSLETELENIKKAKKELEEKYSNVGEESLSEIDISKNVDIIDINEDILFEDNGVEKVKKSYDDLVTYGKKIQKEVESLRNKETQKAEEPPAESESVEKEYSDIDSFVSKNTNFFGNVLPIEKLESKYLDFATNIANSIGVKGTIFDNNGKFIPEVNDAIGSYWKNDDNGKKIREAIEGKTILTNEENEALNTIYTTRSIKKEYNIPYDVALEIYRARTTPKQEDLDLRARLEEKERLEKAKDNLTNHAPETKPNASGGDVDLGKLTTNDLERVQNKSFKDWTDSEYNMMLSVYKQKGLNEEILKADYDY